MISILVAAILGTKEWSKLHVRCLWFCRNGNTVTCASVWLRNPQSSTCFCFTSRDSCSSSFYGEVTWIKHSSHPRTISGDPYQQSGFPVIYKQSSAIDSRIVQYIYMLNNYSFWCYWEYILGWFINKNKIYLFFT